MKRVHPFSIVMIILQALLTAVLLYYIYWLSALPVPHMVVLICMGAAMLCFTIVSQQYRAGYVVGLIFSIIVCVAVAGAGYLLWRKYQVLPFVDAYRAYPSIHF